MESLDSDLLRTFMAVAKAGSVTDGAERIHRSQSATSIQIKRLETLLGRAVFDRHGRGVVLNETGRRLLPVAQDVTSRLDAAFREMVDAPVQGTLRLGIPDDHGRARLTSIIAQFARLHPAVELDVNCGISTDFPGALERGELDLAMYEVSSPAPHEVLLAEDATCWVAANGHDFTAADTLPVALFDRACWWRDAAIASLQACKKPYRIAYCAQSVSGVLAAVEAGIAVGLLGRSSVHADLTVLDQRLGFSPTPTTKLVMATADLTETAPVAALKSTIEAAFRVGKSH